MRKRLNIDQMTQWLPLNKREDNDRQSVCSGLSTTVLAVLRMWLWWLNGRVAREKKEEEERVINCVLYTWTIIKDKILVILSYKY